jgi:hypothetical protein
MPYPIILQFAADHPVTAFFLSWPTAFLILGVAWTVATLLNNAMNAILMVYNQTVGSIAVLARGYPPVEKGDGGEGGEDGEGKPLAG